MNNEIKTLEDVEKYFEAEYKRVSLDYSIMARIKLKSWLNYVKRTNQILSFKEYLSDKRYGYFVDEVADGKIDCSDLGGYEQVMFKLING